MTSFENNMTLITKNKTCANLEQQRQNWTQILTYLFSLHRRCEVLIFQESAMSTTFKAQAIFLFLRRINFVFYTR